VSDLCVVYGGTFDPIHNGHLRVAIELREMLKVHEIRLMPASIPPHRPQPGASAQERLELMRLATSGEPGLVLDDRELQRHGASYTALSLQQLRAELGPQRPLAMVVGYDAFAGFADWRDWPSIPELAHIIVVNRPGQALPDQPVPATLIAERGVESPDALNEAPAGGVLTLQLPAMDISASTIREKLAAGRSPRFLLPDAVLWRIFEQGLYQSRSENPQS